MDKPRVVNLNELPEPKEFGHDGRFTARMVPVAVPLGAHVKESGLLRLRPARKTWCRNARVRNARLRIEC